MEVGDSDREPATGVYTQPAQPLPPTSASEEEAVTDTPPLEQLPQVHPTAVASPVRPPPPVPIQILPVVRPPTSAEEEKLDQGVPEFPPVTPAPAVVEPPKKKKKKKKRFRRTRPIREEKTEAKVPEIPAHFNRSSGQEEEEEEDRQARLESSGAQQPVGSGW